MEQYGSVERGWLWWPAGRVGVTSYSLTGLEQMVLVFVSSLVKWVIISALQVVG